MRFGRRRSGSSHVDLSADAAVCRNALKTMTLFTSIERFNPVRDAELVNRIGLMDFFQVEKRLNVLVKDKKRRMPTKIGAGKGHVTDELMASSRLTTTKVPSLLPDFLTRSNMIYAANVSIEDLAAGNAG
jgi:hypothetical protein